MPAAVSVFVMPVMGGKRTPRYGDPGEAVQQATRYSAKWGYFKKMF